MSKIRDIINAASGGGWPEGKWTTAKKRFLATFNPEHVALMEAVIEASNELRLHSDSSTDDQWQDNALDWDMRLLQLECNEYKAITKLIDYRKVRGLL